MDIILILNITKIIVIIITIIFLFFTTWSIYTNLTTKVPWAKTPDENIEKILAEISLPKNSLVYDLGCGDGKFLFAAERRGYQAIGYELSLYPFIKGWTKKTLTKSSVMIRRKNFFEANLRDADAVFIFLVDKVMDSTGKKLKKELKPNVPVISYGFEIPNWTVQKILDTEPSQTYIYNS